MIPQQQYKILHDYAEMKLYQKDWHGVRDAACDIEIFLAANPGADKEGGNVKPWCKDCNKIFDTMEMYRIHMDLHHAK